MSGQPGQGMKHGAALWLRRGVLPKGKRFIAKAVDSVLAQYADDLGDEMSAGQRIIMQQLRQQLIFLCLVDEWIERQPSIVDDAGEMLGPLNAFYLACSNSVQRACEKLGLKRVSIADNLETYLAQKASTTDGDQQKVAGKQARRKKIVDPGATSQEKLEGDE